MTDLVGQQLSTYRLLQLLGSGGFADVYLGEHVYLKTKVAVKVLHAHLTNMQREKFKEEASLVASLVHPHIIRILHFDIQNNIPFLVMDYAPNGTLQDRHPEGTRVSLTTVVSYIKQIASALQYAHVGKKLVHRDITPDNLLVGLNNEILVSDFGIAVLTRSYDSQPLGFGGKFHYMAPEQIRGRPRRASDQYALGIIVYEWLCGTLPFDGSFNEVVSQHLTTPPPPFKKDLHIPTQIAQVVMKALAKDPDQRFVSVKEFATALEQAYQTQQPPPIKPKPQVPPITSPTPSPAAASSQSVPSPQAAPAIVQKPVQAPQPAIPKQNAKPASPIIASPSIGTILFTYLGHSSPVHKVLWSPSGPDIASCSQKIIHVWTAATGDNRITFNRKFTERGVVTWSPNGQYIAFGEGRRVEIWDSTTRNKIFTYTSHSEEVTNVIWSPNGQHIATQMGDWTFRVWDALTGNEISSRPCKESGLMAWSPNGQWIASPGESKNVEVWEANTGKDIFDYQSDEGVIGFTELEELLKTRKPMPHVGRHQIAWSPNGRYIACVGMYGTVGIWDSSIRERAFLYQSHTTRSTFKDFAWSPNGQRIAAASHDETVQIWDALTGNHVFIFRGHSDVVTGLSWSPDGKYVASCSDDKTVQIWKAV